MNKFRAITGLAFAAAIFFSATSAFAAEATLQVRAKIVQCGAREHIAQACMENSLCCGFVDQIAAEEIRTEDPEKGAALAAAMEAAKIEQIKDEAKSEMTFKVVTARDTFFADQDVDGNGTVTMDEFLSNEKGATAAIFAKLDRNHDGELSKPELSKYRAAIRG